METLQFDLNPFSFIAVPLFIVGLASTVYLLRIQEKTAATWFATAGLAGFTLGMASMFASAIVLWGSVFNPTTDACAVFSMAAMIGFGYHYPEKVHSLEARLAALFASSTSLLALGVVIYYAYRVFVHRAFGLSIPVAYWFLNPLTFLVALGVSIRRAIAVHQQARGRDGWREALLALRRPQGRQARLLRNFSLALALGLIQGVASGLGIAGLLPLLLSAYILIFAMFAMVVMIVYASFDLRPQQPSLNVRLSGLSLVTLLTVLGAFGVYDNFAAMVRVDEQRIAEVKTVRKMVQAGNLNVLPEAVNYVIAWPQHAGRDYRLLYAREVDFDPLPLVEEHMQQATDALPPMELWIYYVEAILRSENRTAPVRLRYGSHPLGSYHQYAGYTFIENDFEYEIGFSLAEMSRVVRDDGLGMVYAVVLGSLFILLVFPLFFRANLARPLDRLLASVRQADSGDLDVSVPVTREDEIGFLTEAFNKMTASLRESDKHLREINVTLEQRVVDRTRELQALYDVSAVASRAESLDTLLSESLRRTMEALRSDIGAIYLLRDAEKKTGPNCLQLVAHHGIPPGIMPPVEASIPPNDLFDTVLAQRAPVLVPDITANKRVPEGMRQSGARTLLVAPMQAEGQIWGLIGLMRGAEYSYNVEEVALLASIADQIGVAVQNDQLRQIAQQATVLQERQRLARDLHDSVTQSLIGLVTLTEVGQTQIESGVWDAMGRTFVRMEETARQALKEMRLFIHQLRPPALEEAGLVGALHLRLAAVEGHSGVRARLLAGEIAGLPLPVEYALYQIAQEALNNTLKHAHADAVTVGLEQEGEQMILEVVDNGCGFDPEAVSAGGMGLGNMRERAEAIGGVLEVDSRVGEGTRVRAVVGSRV